MPGASPASDLMDEAADEIESLRLLREEDHRRGCGESRTGSDGETAVEDVAKCTVKSKKLPERERLTNHTEKPNSSTLTARGAI